MMSSLPSAGGAVPEGLAGLRILLVEDEAILALDLRYTLEDAGASVIGPIVTVPDAVRAANSEAFDAAILDIDLQGRDVFPAAEILAARRIPFVFHTGHGRPAELETAFAGVPVCAKPADPDALLRTLARTIRDRAGPPAS